VATTSPLTPEERSLRASIAANTSWGRTPDRTARTAPARRALEETFLAQVPDTITDPVERARAAENLRRAHFQRMALKSAQARRANRTQGAVA
jgi:hypothetical protein